MVRIATTSWVNCACILLAAHTFSTIRTVIVDGLSLESLVRRGLLSSLFYIFLHELLLWLGFINSSLILDLVLFTSGLTTRVALAIESLTVSGPFIYWGMQY